MRKILTLCIVHRHPKILLGLKKRGFGRGKWNGFGGKVESGESVEEAARRELLEEAGIQATGLFKVGVLEFGFKDSPEILEVHYFRITDFSGEPRESEEMKPQWFSIPDIPFQQMWPDDRYWMPLFLSGKKFRGRFIFDGHDTILDKNLIEMEGI